VGIRIPTFFQTIQSFFIYCLVPFLLYLESSLCIPINFNNLCIKSHPDYPFFRSKIFSNSSAHPLEVPQGCPCP